MNHFPILIEYTETGKKVVCKTPEELVSGKSFRVLETCYNKKGDSEVGSHE